MSDAWSRIDDLIVNARYLPAMAAIREATGASVQGAIDIFGERYDVLRAERPNDFTLPPDEYGRGVYT